MHLRSITDRLGVKLLSGNRSLQLPALLMIMLLMLVAFSPEKGLPITLDEAIMTSLEESDSYQISLQSSEVTRADAGKRISFITPQAEIKAEYFRTDSSFRTFPGFETPEWLKSASVEASQVIWSGGRIWRSLDLKDSLYNQAKLDELSGKRDVTKDVKNNFYGVLFQKALLDILNDRVIQREEEMRDAQDLRDAGMVTSLDVRQARQTLNFARNELETGRTAYHDALIRFNLSLGRSGKGNLLIPEGDLERTKELREALERAEHELTKNNLLDILRAENKLNSSQLNHKIAGAGYFPELQLVGTAKSSNETTGEMDDLYAVGIQLTWNILDGGLVRAQKSAAQAEMIIAAEEVQKVLKELSGRIEVIKTNAASIEKRIELQRETVTLAKENYEDARGQYRAGTINLTRLGEFNLTFAESRFRLLRLFFLEHQLLIQTEALME